ncbi:Fic family protein [Candidatus Gottesmanbacteria bacterium]|nr:Fic family protein [Candidatus Gottesmanbacteria bacterium]
MKIPPLYQITPDILELIAKIEANRIFFSSVPIPPAIKEKIQRISLLKSSLYSARIEGNPLTMEELDNTSDRQKKLEVLNILSAIKFIEKEADKKTRMSKKDILNLHRLVMKNLDPAAGYFRREMGAIFNQAGVAVYMSPPPNQIPVLLDNLLAYINSDTEKFPIICAFISHLVFEKIHPFIEGNGRVGRLLILDIFFRKNWRFNLNVVLEEALDNHKEDYYYYLDIGLKKPQEYLLFMLDTFWRQSEKIKSQIAHESDKNEKVILPPRQEEIYSIIADHKMASFDTIKRRFLKVPARTLRYDLKKLQEKGLVAKVGSTKGTFYRLR